MSRPGRVTPVQIRLRGVVDPNGAETRYRFVYGRTTEYGRETADVSAGAGDGSRTVEARTVRLRPGTTYHAALVATNEGGTTRSADMEIRTAGAPAPVIRGGPVRLRRGRRPELRLQCPAPGDVGCIGRLAVYSGRTLIGRAAFAVKRGTTGKIKLRLTRAGRRKLDRRRKPTKVRVVMRYRLEGRMVLADPV
jgi:hypothetical protein